MNNSFEFISLYLKLKIHLDKCLFHNLSVIEDIILNVF
jgi:hypothetical protein